MKQRIHGIPVWVLIALSALGTVLVLVTPDVGI
jgi:hypothetical protein